jgi:hypothetical protein
MAQTGTEARERTKAARKTEKRLIRPPFMGPSFTGSPRSVFFTPEAPGLGKGEDIQADDRSFLAPIIAGWIQMSREKLILSNTYSV